MLVDFERSRGITPPFPQLMQELEIIDIQDNRKVIDWLGRTLRAAAEQNIEVPHRVHIAAIIGKAHKYLAQRSIRSSTS
jgi:hypothetical protein